MLVTYYRIFWRKSAAGLVLLALLTLVGASRAASACIPAPEGVVGWWPGDGTAEDVEGTNDGTLLAGARADGTGLSESAFVFDGTNAYVRIENAAELNPGTLTLECWVKFDRLDTPGLGTAPAGRQYLVFKQNSRDSVFEGFALVKNRSSGQDYFEFQVSSAAGVSMEVRSTTAISTGIWYHVAAVRSASSIQIYVNGQMQDQASVTFPQNYGSFPLYFGTTGQAYHDRKFAGTLDEVTLYARALSAAEVSSIYTAGAAGKCKLPTIIEQPHEITTYVGRDASFSVGVEGSGPFFYEWRRNDVPLLEGDRVSGTTNATLFLSDLNVDDSGMFQVVVSNEFGAVVSVPVSLTVQPPGVPPAIASSPVNQAVSAGSAVAFNATASGTSPLIYQWYFNGAPLAEGGNVSGATTPALVLKYTLSFDEGQYWLVVTNEFGAATSAVATLTVEMPTNCLPAPPGIVGWWPGDGSAMDIIGTNHGVLMGGATADTNGMVGQAFTFDGTNKYVRIPDSPVLKPQLLSVECWVNYANLQSPGTSTYLGQQYLVFKQNSRALDFEGYVLSKDRTDVGDIILWEVTSAAGQLIRIDSTTVVTTNTWYHLVGIRETNYIALYVNGQLEAATNVDFPQDYGTLPVYFGTSGQSYWDRRLDGRLDEVSLYDRPLSSTEIAALYAAGPAGKCKVPTFIQHPQGTNVYFGSSLSLTSLVTGALPMSFQWSKDQADTPVGLEQGLTFPNVQMTDAGTYSLLATNLYGVRTSATATVGVRLADIAFALEAGTNGTLPSFSIAGAPGAVLGIQGTTNLTSPWFGLTNLMLEAITNAWQDPEPATQPQKYYRVVPGPVPVP